MLYLSARKLSSKSFCLIYIFVDVCVNLRASELQDFFIYMKKIKKLISIQWTLLIVAWQGNHHGGEIKVNFAMLLCRPSINGF